MLLLGKMLVGKPITSLEGLGAIVAFSGAILCSKDGASATFGVSQSLSLLGDVIAAGAGLSGVLYLIFAQTSRLHFSLFMLMFLTMFGSTLIIVLFQVLVLNEDVSFGLDPFNGIWGFLSLERFDRFPLEFINVVVWYVNAGLNGLQNKLLLPCHL